MPADTTSPRYHVAHWRNPETIAEEDTLENFLLWLEQDAKPEPSEATIGYIKQLVNQYLQRDMKKIRQGESELLKNWIRSVKETK